MNRRSALALVTLLMLAGFALRMHDLSGIPFRGDEAFAAQYWAGQPLAITFAQTATIEPHPPLTYILFRGWGLVFGINEFTLRVLPALFNLIGIPALYAIGCRLRGRSLGLIAAFLWAFHPFQVWHAQDARNYAIWAGLSALSVWLGLRVVIKARRADWWLYALAALFSIFVFYLELFTLITMSLFAVIIRWRDRRFLLRWFAVQFIIGVSVALTFWMFQGQLMTSGSYGGTIISFSAPLWFTRFLPALNFGETLPPEFTARLWPPLFIALLLGFWSFWKYDKKQALFLGLMGVIPLLLLGLISLRLNIFHPRYVLPAVPAYILLLAGLVLQTAQFADKRSVVRSRRLLFQAAASILAGGWLAVSVFSLDGYFNNPAYAKSQNWPALTRYLHRYLHPDDLVIQTAVDAAFGYYYNDPAVDIGLPENPQESRKDIIAKLENSRLKYRSIWAVGRTFSDWPNAGIVEQWLQDNMQRVRSTSTDGLPIQQYMTWEVRSDEIDSTSLVAFDDIAELVDIHSFDPEPTRELTVWVYWRALKVTDKPLKAFIHLIGDINPASGTPLWTQDDQFPQDGHINTTTWNPGAIYRDVYTLPLADVPPGEYTLEIGLYEPDANQRIPVGSGDSYPASQITLP